MGGNRPVTFITIGGVRYHRDSVVEQSETTDDKGNKTYNVTLEGGTKLSYPLQKNLTADIQLTFSKGMNLDLE